MSEKKQTNILMTPETHLRLKVNAAMLGLPLGDLVSYMLERQFPLQAIDDALYFSRGIEAQELAAARIW